MDSKRNSQAIFILIGTIINIDMSEEFIEKVSRKMRKNDLLIFDVTIPIEQPSERKRILTEDPRLSDRLPMDYVTSVEKCVEAGLFGMDPSIASIGWKYSLDEPFRTIKNQFESYSIYMNATLFRSDVNPQQVSCMRIHRHDPNALGRYLDKYGLTLIEQSTMGLDPDVRYPTSALAFMKR